MKVVHEYPDINVRLTLFQCIILQGELKFLEYNDIKWVTSAEISNYEFCPADVEILKKIQTLYNEYDKNHQGQLLRSMQNNNCGVTKPELLLR